MGSFKLEMSNFTPQPWEKFHQLWPPPANPGYDPSEFFPKYLCNLLLLVIRDSFNAQGTTMTSAMRKQFHNDTDLIIIATIHNSNIFTNYCQVSHVKNSPQKRPQEETYYYRNLSDRLWITRTVNSKKLS